MVLYDNIKKIKLSKEMYVLKVYESISELVGKTPLIELKNFERNNGLKARVVAKAEYFNPAGSAKDRIAKMMIDEAEKKGTINRCWNSCHCSIKRI